MQLFLTTVFSVFNEQFLILYCLFKLSSPSSFETLFRLIAYKALQIHRKQIMEINMTNKVIDVQEVTKELKLGQHTVHALRGVNMTIHSGGDGGDCRSLRVVVKVPCLVSSAGWIPRQKAKSS